MIAQVIESGKATLRELRECYSMHDLYSLWEVVHEEKYRKWLAYEERRKQIEARKRQ